MAEGIAPTRNDAALYRFGLFTAEARERLLLRETTPVPLTAKAFDVLLILLAHQGRLVAKRFLLDSVWPGIAVEENNLNQAISALRRACGEPSPILTVPGRGYRFVCSPPPQPRRTVVLLLPFQNLNGGPDRDSLADGLTEEAITALGQMDPERLGVVGRTTAMVCSSSGKSLAETAREVGASYVVESSLRTEGDRLRITSRLLRADDQTQLWTASFNSEPWSLLQFQRELAAALSEQITLQLSPKRTAALARRHTGNTAAYTLYMQGRHLWNQLTGPTTRAAVECFRQATQLDPRYALAWSGLADAFTYSPIHGDAPPLRAQGPACGAMERAAEQLDLPEVQTTLGAYQFWLGWNWAAAERHYRRALELDPCFPLAHRMLAVLCFHMGRFAEADAAISRARELDYQYVMHQALSSQVAFHARRFADAVHFAREAIACDPRFWIARLFLAQAHTERGEHAQALQALDDALSLGLPNSKLHALRGVVLARMGREDEARVAFAALQMPDQWAPPAVLAQLHLALGEREHALDWLDDALVARDVHLLFLPVDPKWDPLRDHPRFRGLLARCPFLAAPVDAFAPA